MGQDSGPGELYDVHNQTTLVGPTYLLWHYQHLIRITFVQNDFCLNDILEGTKCWSNNIWQDDLCSNDIWPNNI